MEKAVEQKASVYKTLGLPSMTVKHVRKKFIIKAKSRRKRKTGNVNHAVDFTLTRTTPHFGDDWVTCVECLIARYHSCCAANHGQFDNNDVDAGDFTCAQCYDGMY